MVFVVSIIVLYYSVQYGLLLWSVVTTDQRSDKCVLPMKSLLYHLGPLAVLGVVVGVLTVHQHQAVMHCLGT